MADAHEGYLTAAEIHRRFDAEWVLIENPDRDAHGAVTGGNMLWHSKDRDELYRKALELRPRHWAVLYTGTIPENAAVAL